MVTYLVLLWLLFNQSCDNINHGKNRKTSLTSRRPLVLNGYRCTRAIWHENLYRSFQTMAKNNDNL